MVSKEKLVPRLKFGGFMKDGWILKKVSDLANTTYGGGTPTTSVIEYWRGDIPWISSSDLVENNVHNVTPSRYITKEAINNSATKLVPKNSIAIVTRVGVGKLALVPFEYTASQDFLSISNINGNGLYSVYALYKLLQIVKNETQGTSIKGITKDKLLDKNLYIPTNIEEQIKIGTFFKKIDEMIQLQQSKVNKVKDIKSAYLFEMFPKEGEEYPEKRFGGFIKPWKKYKLSDIVTFLKGRGLARKDMVENGQYECILYGHLYTVYGMVIDNIIYKTNTINQNMITSQKGDVLIPSSDTTPTGLARASSLEKDDIILGGDINILRPNRNIEGSFLSYNINANRSQLLKLIKGTTVKHIYNDDLKDVLVRVPEKEEQKLIVELFRNIDNQITIEEEKLKKLEKLKQAYLNDMFV